MRERENVIEICQACNNYIEQGLSAYTASIPACKVSQMNNYQAN